MKRKAAVLIMLLLMMLSLAACHASKREEATAAVPDKPEQSNPAQPVEPEESSLTAPELSTEPESTAPELNQGDAEGDGPYAVYRELIEQITAAMEDKWQSASPKELDVSEVFAREEPGSFGWLQRDINHDGVDELLLGENLEGEEPNPSYDIFTVLNGHLSHTAAGWAFSKWYVTEKGTLVNETSSDGFDRIRTAYAMFNGQLLLSVGSTVDRSEYLNLRFESFS